MGEIPVQRSFTRRPKQLTLLINVKILKRVSAQWYIIYVSSQELNQAQFLQHWNSTLVLFIIFLKEVYIDKVDYFNVQSL